VDPSEAPDSQLPAAEDERRRQRQSRSERSDVHYRAEPEDEFEYRRIRSVRESAPHKSSLGRRLRHRKDRQFTRTVRRVVRERPDRQCHDAGDRYPSSAVRVARPILEA
jgi:hypothetical protein